MEISPDSLSDPFFLVQNSQKLDKSAKRKIIAKLKMVEEAISQIEEMSGLPYPAYYVDPILTTSVSPDDNEGLGILYARTIPFESEGMVKIIVQLSAALLLCGTKSTLKLVLSHEFLHYLELVKQFSTGNVSSESTPSYLFEERYEDADRALDPKIVFPNERKLGRDLASKFENGFSDEKLNEKCRTSWIERGLPVIKIPIAENQVRLSMEALANSNFDSKVVEFVSKLDSGE